MSRGTKLIKLILPSVKDTVTFWEQSKAWKNVKVMRVCHVHILGIHFSELLALLRNYQLDTSPRMVMVSEGVVQQ